MVQTDCGNPRFVVVCRYSKTARNRGNVATLKPSRPVVSIAMSEKPTKAGELCDKETPTAYGVELDSVVAVANAFVDEPFNGSLIAVRSSDDLVTIRSLETRFRHMDALLEAQKQGHISIRSISAGTNYDGAPCLNIEVVEAE